ncbi:MAG: hypothetical protein EOP56_01600 [Sphingobacteriales bacterium]|nr:MAG: hypothetical protein EOP56_01600 [Sphingobacteriales bacterium]
MSYKKCSRCDKEFECRADSHGCWCEQYTLSAEALQQLRSSFSDCLCPDCLTAYQALPADSQQ